MKDYNQVLRELMKQPTPEPSVEEVAKRNWYYAYQFKEADQDVRPYLAISKRNSGPWLKRARNALLLSGIEVARRLQISTPAYYKIEQNEARGSVTLRQLERAAEAMGCEVVYAMRPRGGGVFSEVIWRQTYPEVKEFVGAFGHVNESSRLRGVRWGGRLRWEMQEARFRKERRWSKRLKAH